MDMERIIREEVLGIRRESKNYRIATTQQQGKHIYKLFNIAYDNDVHTIFDNKELTSYAYRNDCYTGDLRI